METIEANFKPRGGGERQKNKVISGRPATVGSGKIEHFLLAGYGRFEHERVNSGLLAYSFLVKTILIFNATEIPCGEHRKFELFVGYCFVVS